MKSRWASTLIFMLGTFLLACQSTLHLNNPYIVINFGDVDLVLEGADSPEDAIVVQRGEIQFLVTEDVGFYRAVNSGSINVWGIDFVYSETSLSCVCPELDKSLGAVIFYPDGRLVPANLLPLLGR
jgi:hypothetical protein